jgi:hypothetical protein
MGNKFIAATAHELIEMSRVDQDMRIKAIKDMSLWNNSIDQRNTTRLKQIIGEIGWPTISKVGKEASQDAWLLVQHATEDIGFMKECLELMKASEPGDVSPTNTALLEDRLLTMEDKPQIYGTQFNTINGITKPFPIEDEEHVDERRASVGLDTFAENEARIKAIYDDQVGSGII